MFKALKKYDQLSGRATRSEYWGFWLLNLIVGNIALIIDFLLGFQVVVILVSLCMLVPNITVAVRRLHDTGRSGWWLLLPLAPALFVVAPLLSGFESAAVILFFFAASAVCTLLLIVWLTLPSQRCENSYGGIPS
ncbi:MAG: DUF805 domain-containing protein [Oceanospirillaceae bacterium]|nr:DUF805 domain-containing protein [Oceanospirillaceae bacterium]